MTRKQRIAIEIATLALHYGEIEFDDEDGTWVLIRSFPLPHGIEPGFTPLLITLPIVYPMLPPSRFFISPGLPIKDHYYEANALRDKNYAWYCLHLENGWNESSDIWSGDNLMTVTAAISTSLTEILKK